MKVKLNSAHVSEVAAKYFAYKYVHGVGVTRQNGRDCFVVITDGDTSGMPKSILIDDEEVPVVYKFGGQARML